MSNKIPIQIIGNKSDMQLFFIHTDMDKNEVSKMDRWHVLTS